MKIVGDREQAFEDFKKGMPLKDIASRQEVSLSTVKSWSRRYGWKDRKKRELTQHLFVKRLQKDA